MAKNNVTMEDFDIFKKDMLDLMKMYGKNIDDFKNALKQITPPMPGIKPNMPSSARQFCFLDIVIARPNYVPDPVELATIKSKMTLEISAVMDKYKVSKIEAIMLRVYD